MKKSYVKPAIYLESFRMSDAVAGNCSIDVGFSDGTGTAKACGIRDGLGDYLLFNKGVWDGGVCSTLWDDGTNKGCYHIPTNGHGYFGS